MSKWRQEFSATLGLAWPLILANLSQIALTTTDVVMMGWYSTDALAGGTLGANFYLTFFVVGLGIATATAPLLAHALGGRRRTHNQVRSIVQQGLWASLLYCLAAWVVLSRTEWILTWIGEPADLAKDAGAYVGTLQWGLLPGLWFLVLRCFVSALERPKPALLATIAAIIINAGGCWTLMFGQFGAPRLGLTGAGIASTFANTTTALVLAVFVLRDCRFRRYHLLARMWRLDLAWMAALLRLGLPMSLAAGFEITAFSAAALIMGFLGPQTVAAHAIAIQVAMITYMVPLGIGQAATIRVGLAAGADDHLGVRCAGRVALTIGIGFMAAMAVILIAVPDLVVGLFLDRRDPVHSETIRIAVTFLAVAAVFQVFDGAQCVGTGVLRGLKDTRMPMVFAAVGYWGVGLPLGTVLVFPGHMGGIGLWIGLALGLATVAALVLGRWSRIEPPGLSKPPP